MFWLIRKSTARRWLRFTEAIHEQKVERLEEKINLRDSLIKRQSAYIVVLKGRLVDADIERHPPEPR